MKQFNTVKAFVNADLQGREYAEVKAISVKYIDAYFTDLQRTKAHLCSKPLKLATVNRYVELYVKANKSV